MTLQDKFETFINTQRQISADESELKVLDALTFETSGRDINSEEAQRILDHVNTKKNLEADLTNMKAANEILERSIVSDLQITGAGSVMLTADNITFKVYVKTINYSDEHFFALPTYHLSFDPIN